MRNLITGVLLASSLCIAGCTQQEQQNAEQDLQRGAANVERTLEKGAKDVGKAVSTGVDTGKLKSALMASEKLNTDHLNVDKEGNTFYLRGSVPDAEQKALAARIANDVIGKDEKVVDELQVGATTTTVQTTATPVQESTETTTTVVTKTETPNP
jgi:osmotically-inducible protein OsmY